MTTTSRTYLPTDWQVWTYAPVAGKFRLDFSALNGSDVLGGSTDTGGMAVLDIDINSIVIEDGQRPEQSVFASNTPATATVSMSTRTWSASTVQELYGGKAFAITLKNQATVDIDVYGRNSVFFLGAIENTTYFVDPINQVTNFTITAKDIFSNALNQQISVNRSTTSSKASSVFAGITANSNLFDSHLSLGSNIDLTAQFETNTTEIRSLGAWLDDYIQTYVSIPVGYYYLNGTQLQRNVDFNPLHVEPTSGTQITDSKVLNVEMTTDGDNIPTSFNLSNTTTSYTSAQSAGSILTTPIDYTTTLDVNGATQLQQVATRITSYVPALSPVAITLRTAMPYQSITFDNAQAQSGGQYYYPNNWYANGTDLDIYMSYFGNVHYYTKIVGQSHEITPDSWLTTYQLLKGR